MRRTTRATKHEWGYRTIRQPQATVAIVEGLVRGQGNVWPFDGSVYSTKGLAPDGTPVYSDEIATAVDGAPMTTWAHGDSVKFGTGAIGVWDGTTNLCIDEIRNASDKTYFTAIQSTLTDDTTDTIDGDSIKVATAHLTDLEGVHTSCNPGFGSNGKTYTGLVWIKIDSSSDDDELRVYLRDQTNGVSGAVVSIAPGVDTWCRVTCSMTIAGGDCSELRIYAVTENDVANTFWVDRIQIEELDHVTAWVDGTRANENFEFTDIDWLTRGAGFTLSAWTAGPSVTAGAYIFRIENSDSSNRISLYHNSAGGYSSQVSGAGAPVVSGTQAWGTRQGPHHIAVVVDFEPYGSDPNLAYYFDGVLLDSDTGTMPTLADMAKLYFGHNGASGEFNGVFDDLALLPYAADAALVLAIHGLGHAFPALPAVELNGDVVNNTPVEVLGVVEGMDIKPYSDDGSWRHTAGSVAFKLLER